MANQRKIILTERDLELLLSVYRYRYLSVSQVRALHFPSAQTANRRVRLLVQADYLSAFQVPGLGERMVMLAKQGAEAVAESLLVPLPELGWDGKRTKPKDYYFIKHFLSVNDFRIALTRACEQLDDVSLLGFISEQIATKTSRGGLKKHIQDVAIGSGPAPGKIGHTPDGVFALRRGDRVALFFLEIDRGAEVLSNPERGLLKTIRFYLNYLKGGGYSRYQADFQVEEPFKAFRALFVTTSRKRLENVRTVGGRLRFDPEHAKRFLWLATDDVIDADRIFSPRWVSLDSEDEERYGLISS